MVDKILSQILYGVSGFFFAIFAVRYSRVATTKLKMTWQQRGFGAAFFLSCLPSMIFLLFTAFLFPILFYTRTPVGGFVYLATYVFFNMKVRKHK